ncbi:MAG: alkylmercury lyase [Mycobacterium sp.]
MRIEILTAPGCPNAAGAKETVAECLTALGVEAPIVERVGRYPSPTILIDGVDVMGSAPGVPIGDACRLDLPTPQRVLEALRGRPQQPSTR